MNLDFNLQMVLLIGLNLVGFLLFLIAEVRAGSRTKQKAPVRPSPASFLFGEALPQAAESCRRNWRQTLHRFIGEVKSLAFSMAEIVARNLRRTWSKGNRLTLRGGGAK